MVSSNKKGKPVDVEGADETKPVDNTEGTAPTGADTASTHEGKDIKEGADEKGGKEASGKEGSSKKEFTILDSNGKVVRTAKTRERAEELAKHYAGRVV